MLQNKIIN